MSLPDDSYRDDAVYESTLAGATLKKAQEEIHENPRERAQAIKQLREWIHRQPHLNCRTDNYNMIRFLRGAKFSQLRAREMLEGYYTIRPKYPAWFHNVDTHSKKLHYIIDQGYMFPLPGRDKEGRRIMLQRTAALKLDDKNFTIGDMVQLQITLTMLLYRDEETQVHGSLIVGDHTDATLKHFMRFPIEDMKVFMKTFQKATPGRFKGFHVYNAGALFETLMSIMKPILSAKFQNRMTVHSNLESLYKHVPMEMLPEEYLPDDYKGPCAGSIKQICDNVKKQIMEEEFRKFMLFETNPEWGCDPTKKPAEVEGAFRKLNVD